MATEILPDYALQCEQCGRSSTDDAVGFCGDCCRCDNCCRCDVEPTYSVTALAWPNGAAGLPLLAVLARGVSSDVARKVAAIARHKRGHAAYSRVRIVMQG